MKKLVCCILILCMGISLAACSTPIRATDLMEGITPNAVRPIDGLGAKSETLTDFAVRLFKTSAGEKNTLVSPLSVLCALAMTLNGADGETRAQMERTIGMSAEELNLYLYSYANALPKGEKYKLSLANSIWFTEDGRFEVRKDFLQTNADYYGADIYAAPFDGSTLRDINKWVKDETDGMIPKIIDSIPPDAVTYLINALAFEAEWEETYEKSAVRDGTFTKADGTAQSVDFMHGYESRYIDDGSATGFIKYYAGRKYAFVAMLPNEGVTLSEYVDALDGESLAAELSAPQAEYVRVAIPKFESEYSAELSEVLAEMGITDAFDRSKADLSLLGSSTDGNLSISEVRHKTYISVGEQGTKAGAATSIGVKDGAAGPSDEAKSVILDRPFLYMLIDCETNIPFFIGTMTDTNS